MPAPMRSVIKKACQPAPQERYESADAFLRSLKRFEASGVKFDEPSTALCTNFKCPGAQWTERGYYEGPRVIEKTIDYFCKKCGGQLTYPCEGCNRPFGGDQYCGACGKRHYDIPTCKTCGSWLKEEDMDTDTAEKGCQKCRSRTSPGGGYSYSAPASSADDDIPF